MNNHQSTGVSSWKFFNYRVGLSRFLNIMRRDNDGFVAIFGDLDQMVPDALTQERINADGRFVQNEKLRIVHQGYREGNSSLLTPATEKKTPKCIGSQS